MDRNFNKIENIIKERKTSSRTRFMLQDLVDLRKVSVEILQDFFFFHCVQQNH